MNENFDKYLTEKMGETPNVNEQTKIDKQNMFSNYVEFNWYIDKQISLLESIGGENERA